MVANFILEVAVVITIVLLPTRQVYAQLTGYRGSEEDYMFFFDCKCKSLKRLGEHIKKNRERNINNKQQLEEKH